MFNGAPNPDKRSAGNSTDAAPTCHCDQVPVTFNACATCNGQGGSLHLDFLLLTARGCIVIDLRDIAGNIFGGDQMTEWTVMHRDRRYTFSNPQAGLYDRVAAVRALAMELPVEGRVVFSARGQFPKGLPRYTLMLDSVAAEFPAAEREQSGALPEPWRADWGRVSAAWPTITIGFFASRSIATKSASSWFSTTGP